MNILIKEFIDSIDEEELYKLQYDLSKGSIALKKTVEEKIKEVENRKRKYCAVCGEELAEKEGVYTLIFPHENLTKKASFCATDCMEFFLAKVKMANNYNNKEKNQRKESKEKYQRKESDEEIPAENLINKNNEQISKENIKGINENPKTFD